MSHSTTHLKYCSSAKVGSHLGMACSEMHLACLTNDSGVIQQNSPDGICAHEVKGSGEVNCYHVDGSV